MATKLQLYTDMAEHAATWITGSRERWMGFLDTAARLYKYPFAEQLMIYTQRPDATACAPLETWNEPMNRLVKRGSKGIALIDSNGYKPRLRYVFDVADTDDGRGFSDRTPRRPFLWQVTPENETIVINALTETFGEAEGGLTEILYGIAAQLAAEYFENNAGDIQQCAENSFLEEMDEAEFEAVFVNAATVSAAHSIMSRCGIDPLDFFEDEDYQAVFDFNSATSVHALGTAVSEVSEQVLRQIEVSVKNYERQKARETTHGRSNLHQIRRLSDSRPDPAAAAGSGVGKIRALASDIPEKPPEDIIQFPAPASEAVPAFVGDRQDSGGAVGVSDTAISGGAGSDGTVESQQSDEMGRIDEQHPSPSGGSDTERVSVRLEPQDEQEIQTPSVLGDLALTDGVSLADRLAGSAFPLEAVDAILSDGSNTKNSLLRIAAQYMKGKTTEDNAVFLRREYREGGKGFRFGTQRIAVWFNETGMKLGDGSSVFYDSTHSAHLTWEQIAVRISELINNGQFVSQDVLDNAFHNERSEVARGLLDLHRDRREGVEPFINPEWYKGSFPDAQNRIAEALAQPEELAGIVNGLSAFCEEYKKDRSIVRFRYNRPLELLQRLKDLQLKPIAYSAGDLQTWNHMPFITDDEVETYLTRGGSTQHSKYRIFSFYLHEHDSKETADFLKKEYGHGGGTHALSGADNSYADAEPGKGITIKRGGISNPYDTVNLTYSKVARMINELINTGRYMTRDELDGIPAYERDELGHSAINFFYNLPDDVQRPFSYTAIFDINERKHAADMMNDPAKVAEIIGMMESVMQSMSPGDRDYEYRSNIYRDMLDYQNGTFNLFPNITPNMLPENSIFVSGETTSPEPSGERTEQLPVFPTEAEQRETITQSIAKAEENESSASIMPAATQDNLDAVLLNISVADNTRLGVQFRDNPRSREAARLVREVYGDRLPVSLPAAIKRITELVDENKIPMSFSHMAQHFEWQQIKIKNPGCVVMYQMGDFFEMYQEDAKIASDILDAQTFSRDVGLPERIIVSGIPAFKLDEYAQKLISAGYPVVSASVGEDRKRVISTVIPTTSTPPRFVACEIPNREGAYGVWDNIIKDFGKNEKYKTVVFTSITEANAYRDTLIADSAASAFSMLDFDTAARTVLERVLIDADYIEALTNAKNRAELRNPCAWALEKSVRDHEKDELALFYRYFHDIEFRNRLHEFVLNQSWERRPIERTAEPLPDEQIENTTDIDDTTDTQAEQPEPETTAQTPEIEAIPAALLPTYKLRDEVYLNDTLYTIQWIGYHEVSIHDPAKPETISQLMEKADFEVLLRADKRNTHLFAEQPAPETVHISEVEPVAQPPQRKPTERPAAVRPAPVPAPEIPQADIDAAVLNWNGDTDSKIRVYEYMYGNARSREAAAFLKGEYGGTFIVTSGGERHSLPWPKVQRRIGQLIEAEQFLTPEEQAKADERLGDNWERMVSEDTAPNATAADRQRVSRRPRTVRVRKPKPEQTSQSPAEASPPSAAERGRMCGVGDTVYLEDDKPFIIERMSRFEVSLRDPSLFYPVSRAESYDRFLQILRRNPKNEQFYGYIAADLDKANGDLLDVLNNGLFSDEGKKNILWRLENNATNYELAVHLSESWQIAPDTMTLESGETADYSSTVDGVFIDIQDKFTTSLSFTWGDIAPILRALEPQWSAERDAERLPVETVDETEAEPEPFTDLTGMDGELFDVDDVFEQQQIFVADNAEPETTQIVPSKPDNFRITDTHLGEGGLKVKYGYNAAAIRTLKQIEDEKRYATPEEQEILSRYVGWGGLPQAFDDRNGDWKREYAELLTLLTPEEYAKARASTLTAFYTSPTIIKAMYDTVERLGFKKGNMLDPGCGIGNFFGLLPDSMKNARLYGIELDSITGRIAKHLYPNANITITGYEKSDMPDAFYDIAIGNVPYGDIPVNDRRYDRHNFSIHDYFFAKSLDQVRPGGIIAFITSKFTMDAKNSKTRQYIAQRAELLGAVRLPNNAFLKNANTEIATDILFFQKRDRLIDIQPDWVHLGQTEDGIPVNSYFTEHPEMVLGTMALDKRMNDKYGRTDYTTCYPLPGADLAEQLREAMSNIQGQITENELDDVEGIEDDSIPADPSVRNFSYTLVDGRVYYRENSQMNPVSVSKTTMERIKGMITLRDCAHTLIDYQLQEYSDTDIKAKQAELNKLYDNYTRKYGLLNDRANSFAFSSDSAYYLLCSLEVLDEDGDLERKADIFTKRTIKQRAVVTSVDTASEALAVSIGEKACVDIPYMIELTGKDEATLFAELRGVIFLNFDAIGSKDTFSYQTADEFLSGNVREKLRKYQHFLDVIPKNDALYQAVSDNVAALTAAQPKDLDASEISVRLGSTWVDKKYIAQFITEKLKPPYYLARVIKVNYSEHTGEWGIEGCGRVPSNNVEACVQYGTPRMNAYEIIRETLNLKDARVYDTKVVDGKEKRVINVEQTTLAQAKQKILKQEFKDWIFNDPERRQELCRLYNERFNSDRPREYDGKHINFSGINPEIELKEHQINAIARILYGGNTLLAHVVGAGKTFEMVAAAMESKRLGLCQKSLFAVPNHLTEQWASEFLRLYPSANILVARAKDFETKNRKKFCAKIATGDYDAVIIGHSQLEKIPLSPERHARLLNEQLEEVMDGIEELKASNAAKFSIKQLERTKRSLEARLEKLAEGRGKDDVVSFEQLGIDRLFIDEAHFYKNLFLFTKMRNVAGLSTSDAQKSSDLFAKCKYLDELTGNKGIIFATGTPVSNSMTEVYTMQRYLQYDTLVKNHLTHFDCWASTFGETVTSSELAPEGVGYRSRTRFAQFYNLPELMCMFRDVADIKTSDQLDLDTPTPHFETIAVKPSELQKEMVKELSARAKAVHSGCIDPKDDNMLKITTDGRKIGLDQRLINSMLPDEPGSKVNACTEKVYEIWRDTKPKRLTQLVFCDYSTPNADGRFNLYDDIKAKLIEKGIPESEIAFVHGANTEIKKKELFAKVRKGQIRVLLGSTFKMGAGTNVQDLLYAIHDLDCPWRPSDLEQRGGRIIRQGNTNPDVCIYRYVTEGTFDAYLWQTVKKKQDFISQIMSSKSPVRSCEDVDETALSYAEIMALCAGNPLIKERMDLDIEVSRLRLLKADYKSQRYRLEDNLLKYFPESIERTKGNIEGFKSDMERLAGNTPADPEAFPPMVVNGVTYTEKEKAGDAILEACKHVKNTEPVKIGTYRGFTMYATFDIPNRVYKLILKGKMSHTTELGQSNIGNITRINNALTDMPGRLRSAEAHLNGLNQQMKEAEQELQKPFAYEQELNVKSLRLIELDAALNIDAGGGQDAPVFDGEDEAAAKEERYSAKEVKTSILEGLKLGGISDRTTERQSRTPEATI